MATATRKKKTNPQKEIEKEYETKLIAEIARRPYIYDRSNEYYTEYQLRVDAWREISDSLKKSVRELKKKWETLRDTYRKFYKKENSDHNGQKTKIKWTHYETLRFLTGHMKLDDAVSAEQSEIQKDFDAKLITEVINHKGLYDPMNESFRNMRDRSNTWDVIGKVMNASVEVCKKRWNYSRDTFRKFHKREMKEKKDISWVHYDSLKFLLDYDPGNIPDFRPPHTYTPSKPLIPAEYKNLPPLADVLGSPAKSEYGSDFENDADGNDDLNESSLEKKNIDLTKKCGEILITKSEKFSYVCSICKETLDSIEAFIKHTLDTHMGKGDSHSMFDMKTEINDITIDDFFNDDNIDNNDDYKSENENIDETDEQQKCNEINEENDTTTTTVNKNVKFKYIKNVIKNEQIEMTEEDLQEDPNDDPETAALKRLKRQNKLVKISVLGKFPCSFCSFSFNKKENLEKHEATHRKVMPYIFEQKKEKGVFPCDECDRRFQYRHQLQRHKRLHTGERPYKCTLCEQKFRHYDNLKEHYIFRHTDERPYPCRHEGCDKKFKTVKTRSSHEVLHSQDLPFQCHECGKCFPRNSYLKRHRNTWHMDKNDRPYKCPHCTKSFCTQQNLKYHVYTHTGERPFGCPICPSKFTKPWTIKEHMKIHSGERNYVCKICGKDFSQIAGLIKHKRRHDQIAT